MPGRLLVLLSDSAPYKNGEGALPWLSSGGDSELPAQDYGFDPCSESQDPTHLRAKTPNAKQKQYCNKLNEDFKNSPQQKKPLKMHGSSLIFQRLVLSASPAGAGDPPGWGTKIVASCMA